MAAPQHALYLPRLVLDWLREKPDASSGSVHGTLIFADVSGFTALSDRLAIEMGRGGSEKVTSVMNEAFSELVEIVFLEHGDLLRFGGDALVALFTEEHHSGRACRAAIDMRDAISDIDAGDIDLDISIGIASGDIDINLIGHGHRELLLSGPTVDEVIGAESTASAGQIFVSAVLADEISEVASEHESGYWELEDDPDSAPLLDEPDDLTFSVGNSFSDFISPDFRDLLTLTLQQGEHRPASIGFVKFSGIAALDDGERADALEYLFAAVTNACHEFDVAYVSNDIDKDGGKFILAAGVPRRSSGEEGMALALHSIVSQPHKLKVSGGCARGYVFSGDLGAPSRRVFTVMGDTVNLAARLASAAHAGQVLVTEAALERSRGAFETNRLTALALKGKSKEISPFEIVSAAEQASNVTDIPLFGRDEELRTVTRLLNDGLAGAGSATVLTANDGMGKGQLAKAAVQRLSPEVQTLIVRATSGQSHLLARYLLKSLLGIDQSDDTAAQLASRVKDVAPSLEDWLPIFGRVWGLSLPDTPSTEAIGIDFLASKVATLTAELVMVAIGDTPTLLLVEDFEQADEPSQSLLKELIKLVPNRPCAIVATTQLAEDWPEDVTVVNLGEFDAMTSESFIRWVLGDRVLPASTMALIVQRSSGNPYVLGELTKAALEGGVVPESLEAAALSRLDRLDQRDKQLLMYAAVLGTEARVDLLASLLPDIASAIEDSESWNRLTAFIDTSVIGKIRFLDPLTRDVAYSMLPQRRRQEIHELVANAIEKRARRRPERFVDDLSYHFHLAQDWDRSWTYSLMAAERARSSFAPVDAARFLRRAIEAGETMTVPPQDLGERYETLGDLYQQAGIFPDADGAYATSASLMPETASQHGLLHKRGLVAIQLGKIEQARQGFDEILGSDDATLEHRLEAMLGIAGLEIRTGHHDLASRWTTEVLDLASPDDYPLQRARALRVGMLASVHAGLPEAEEQGRQALAIYEDLGDHAGVSQTLNNLGYHAFYSGAWRECEEFHIRNRQTTQVLGDLLSRALSGFNLGELYLEQGRFDEAELLLDETLAAFRGAGHKVGEAVTRIALGRLYARLGRMNDARVSFERARQVAHESGAAHYGDEVTLGEIEADLLVGDLAKARSTIDEMLKQVLDDPVVKARLHTLESYAAYPTHGQDGARLSLTLARECAAIAGAPHLDYAILEAEARLLRSPDVEHIELAGQLHLRARPAYRTTDSITTD